MCSISEFQKRLKSVNLPVVARDAVQASKTLFIHEQKAQMFAGKTRDQKPTKPPYSAAWYRFKTIRRGQSGVVTLYNKGNFYAKFVMTVKQTTFTITSTDWKRGLLEGKYSTRIFGIGGKYKTAWIKGDGTHGIGVRRAYIYGLKKALQLS